MLAAFREVGVSTSAETIRPSRLARVLARSGDAESVAPLQKLSGDSDAAVAQEGLRALRTLQARM